MLFLKSQQHRNMKKISKNRDTVKKTSSLKISSNNTIPVVFPPSLSQILANSTLTHSVLTNTDHNSLPKTHPPLIVTEDSETYSAITMTENSLTNNNTHSSITMTDRETSLPETHSSITMTDRESPLPETHSSITMTDRETSLPETHSSIAMTDRESPLPETHSSITITDRESSLPETHSSITITDRESSLPETHSSITMTDRESPLPETHSSITMTDQETLLLETQSRTTIVGNKLPDTPVPMTKAGVSLQLPETPQGDFFETSSENSRLSETPQEHSESLAVPHKAKTLTGQFHETTLPVLISLKDQSHVTKSQIMEENNTAVQFTSRNKEDSKSIHRPVIIFSPHSHVTESKTLPVLEERQTFILNSVSLSSASIDDDYDYISSTPQSNYTHRVGISLPTCKSEDSVSNLSTVSVPVSSDKFKLRFSKNNLVKEIL